MNTNNSFLRQDIDRSGTDYLSDIEIQLKELWSQYINCVETDGFTERAKALKAEYFNHYQNYRNDKKWRELVTKN